MNQVELFPVNDRGALFSKDRRYRYYLYRIWDANKPMIMFVGLNPSKADESQNDNTITKVIKIANNNGFGGVFMLNCFPFISTDPDQLHDLSNIDINDMWLKEISQKCKVVVFAWGNFKVVRKTGRDEALREMFPHAKALAVNKNGSPKHPLFCFDSQPLIPFNQL